TAPAVILAGELDCRLVRLGTRVAEEDLPSPTEQTIDGLRHLDLRLGAEQIRYVRQRVRLLRDGIGDDRVCMAEAGHRQTTQEVQLALAVAIPQLAAAAAAEHHRWWP